MKDSPSISASGPFVHLPENVRLRLARVTVWITRHQASLKTSMLMLCLACASGLLGFVVAQPSALKALLPIEMQPSLGAASPADSNRLPIKRSFPTTRQWGELQAEVLRLRALFSRVAEASEIDGAEIALALQLADNRYLDSLVELDDSEQLDGRRFMLAKRAVGHMTTQAELMLSISKQRHKARNFTISGSPVVTAHLTSGFGYRIDPRTGRKRSHRGVDFGGATGNKVLALADGIVTYAGKNGGYGNLVELEHAGGYRTRYAHNEFNLVEVGSVVNKGQVVALMGSTGNSTGTHVHVEVRRNGKAVDPLQFISAGP